MNRRALLAGLAVSSAALGAGAAASFLREPRSDAPPPRARALSERSIYALGSRWTTDEDRALELAELAGSARLLAMMFTTCPSVCPTFVRELLALDRGLPPGLRARTRYTLVSIDPERDTPAVLSRYRDTMGLSRERWTLLRGEARDVRELAQVVGVSYAKTEGADIAHARLVTVLDPAGVVVHQQAGVFEDRERLLAGIGRALA